MKKPCTVCGTPSDGPRCPTHRQAQSKAWARPAGNSALRPTGSTRRWRKLRAAYLRDHPLCELCLAVDSEWSVQAPGWVVQAQEVDHRVPREEGGTDHPDNLRSLCSWHHDRLHGPRRREYDRPITDNRITDGPLVG